MAKTKIRTEITKPDVAGALQVIRAKKSREQIKAERLLPFVPVIDEALAVGWKWSPIVVLIRESGGPSMTKADAQALHAQIKGQLSPDDETKVGEDVYVDDSTNASRVDAKKGEGR